MIDDPKNFYSTYQKDYHKIKATYLKKMLDDLPKYEQEFFYQNFENSERNEFRTALKSDLRQTYFHAIETLFELIFALIPEKNKAFDLVLQFRLTYSNWSETYEKIKDIAKNESALNFLDNVIESDQERVTIGEYLFYMGAQNSKLKLKISESIESIKFAIQAIAKEFINREEYNAYKHGLRIIPALSKLTLVPVDGKNLEALEFDVNDSMSFYTKMKNPDEIKFITKIFDSDRDFRMTLLCSNLIHQIIFYRRVIMRLQIDTGKSQKIGYYFYTKQNILDFTKTDVKIQDMEFTETRIK